MAGLPGLPPPGFSTSSGDGPTEITIGLSGRNGLPGLPPPGFSESARGSGQSSPGFFESVGTGAKNFFPSLLSALSDVPSGVSNIYETATSPLDSILNGTAEKVARGVGGIASGIAGAGAGAMGGAALAPFTFGASIPIGAALGGAAGLLGFNKLNQATGSDSPTNNAQDIQLLGEATGQGLAGSAVAGLTSAAAKGAGKIASKISSGADDAAQAAIERGLGVQYGDRVKGLNRANLYVDDAGNPIPFDQLDDASSIQAPIQKQIEVLKSGGFLDDAPNSPDALKIHLEKGRAGVGQSIQQMIREGDQVVKGQEPLPDFSKAQEYVNSFRDSTRADLTKQLNSIIDDYIAEPGSGFKKLAKFNDKLQKETRFDDPTQQQTTMLKRFATYDLRKFTENLWDEAMPQRAGEWAKANEQFSALSGLGKTLNKRLAKSEPGFISTLTTPVGSGPFIGAGGIGSALLGTGAALPAAGAAWLARALIKSTQNAKPLTYSAGMESLSGAAGNAASALGQIAKGASGVAANSPIPGSLGAGLASLRQLQKEPVSADDQSPQAKQRSMKPGRNPAVSASWPRDSQGRFLPRSNPAQDDKTQESDRSTDSPALKGLSNSAKGTTQEVNKLSSSFQNDAPSSAASKANIRSALEQSSKELKPMAKTEQKDPKIKQVEARIDSDPVDSTIYEMESSRNPKAKNKTSTASGGFQLISSTAKKLGVSDPFDLQQNYEGYLKLKAEATPFVKEPSDYYAFHYLGQPTYLAWKKGKVLNLKQQEQVNYLEEVLIPKFDRIYAKKAKAKTGQVEA